MNTTHPPVKRSHIPGLDSLRAIAVLAVVAYHLAVPYVAGGFLGVTLFFVISGYLITRLLLEEIESHGRLNLIGFWTRRVRRLLPAAYLVIATCLVGALLWSPGSLQRLRADSLAAAAYVTNWRMILHKVPYFESFGLPSPLAHLWSLAIEEQFYLIWPVVLVALIATLRKSYVVAAMLAMIAASSGVMAMTFTATDPNRSYLATDSRIGELLIGALLAVVLHLAADKQPEWSTKWKSLLLKSRAAIPMFLGCATVLGTLVVVLPDSSALAFRGGILLAATAAAGLILSLQSPALAEVASWADRGLAGAIGRRSYSIYLWHYPVLVGSSVALTFGAFSLRRTAIVLVLTGVLAELSYRFIESPVRRHGFARSLKLGYQSVNRLRISSRTSILTAALVPTVLLALAISGVGQPRPVNHGPETVLVGSDPTRVLPRAPLPPTPTPTPAVRPPSATGHPAPPPPSSAGLGPILGKNTVAIGDSLMIDISSMLQQRLPGISINAEIGRQPWTGLDIANSYTQFNRPGATYILGIGTNGAIDTNRLAQFCQHHAAARILLITPHVDRPWVGQSLDAIRAAVRHYPNTRLVDFNSAGNSHPEYFGGDGVHLTTAGVRAMVNLILAAGGSVRSPV